MGTRTDPSTWGTLQATPGKHHSACDRLGSSGLVLCCLWHVRSRERRRGGTGRKDDGRGERKGSREHEHSTSGGFRLPVCACSLVLVSLELHQRENTVHSRL